MSTILQTIAHTALLVAATTAHTISSTPPRIAKDSSDHLLRSSEKDKAVSQSEADKGMLHGPLLFNRLGMLGVAASRVSLKSTAL